MGANDLCHMANLDPRGMIGRIYVGNHPTFRDENDFNKKEEIHTKKRKPPYPHAKDIRFGQIGANLIIFISANFSEKVEIL